MGILYAIDWLGWIKRCFKDLLRIEKNEFCISKKYVIEKDQRRDGLESFIKSVKKWDIDEDHRRRLEGIPTQQWFIRLRKGRIQIPFSIIQIKTFLHLTWLTSLQSLWNEKAYCKTKPW